ncbi:MAG TPA: DUF5362 family protein [Flavobacterium sp.]|nr:DUF5362 family protein [Flavobacterium sp.]
MEENVSFGSEMRLNSEALNFIRESAKWCYFLAIIGFVMIAFMLLAAVFMGSIMSMGNALGGQSNAMLGPMQGMLSVIYVVIAVIYFFPIYYLFKYASDMKAALGDQNEDLLTNAFGYLKSHHKFLGIMAIVVLSFYVLAFIGVALVGAAYMH